MAQPTRLEQVRERLLTAAAAGATNRDAAIMAGISESTLYKWLADTTDPDLGEFGEAYAQAKAASRFRSIRLIAESDDWRAHAWLLERVDPKHFGKAELEPGQLEARLAAYLQGHADAAPQRLPTTTGD